MSCCDDCIKFLLFFFNVIFALSGLALVIVGSILLVNTTSFSDLIQDVSAGLKTPQIFIIVIGVTIFFIASLGCCGAIRESRCMLITFAILLLTIFVIQVAIGIYALSNRSSFKKKVDKGLNDQFAKIPTNPRVKKLFENMERSVECCGVHGTGDYTASSQVVPGSCCEDKADCKVKPGVYWKKGCSAALTDFTGKSGEAIGGVAIGLSIIEILGAIFAFRLACSVL